MYEEVKEAPSKFCACIFIGSAIQLGAGNPGLHSNQVPAQAAVLNTCVWQGEGWSLTLGQEVQLRLD